MLAVGLLVSVVHSNHRIVFSGCGSSSCDNSMYFGSTAKQYQGYSISNGGVSFGNRPNLCQVGFCHGIYGELFVLLTFNLNADCGGHVMPFSIDRSRGAIQVCFIVQPVDFYVSRGTGCLSIVDSVRVAPESKTWFWVIISSTAAQ